MICKNGETRPGKTTITLEHGGATLVVKSVPARVCDNCGEAYIDAEITRQLLESAKDSKRAGVQVQVREFSSST
ncbi:MAG: type II toxin-antitoxin system MqsA family antitoxin [Candidatus Binataceae bacterium]